MTTASRAATLCLLLLAGCLIPGFTAAHPMAPSLLALEAEGQGHFAVTWKVPLQGRTGNDLQPRLPEHCAARTEPELAMEGTGLTARWQVDCGAAGLTGHYLAVDGIASNLGSTLLRVVDGEQVIQRVLTVAQPGLTIPEQPGRGTMFRQYLDLGIEHLLLGIDHVLFVIALCLLVRGARQLVVTITSFTIGHSVTLSAAVLGFVNFSQDLAEVLIVFSIIVAFAEVVRNDPRTLIRRRPWLIGFGFGLLHGLGFAGALTEIGLPPGDIPLALLAFNLGIEIGQLALVAALLLTALALRDARLQDLRPVWRTVPLYGMGALVGLWFWQRVFILAF